MPSDVAAHAEAARRRPRAAHILGQNSGLILAVVILLLSIIGFAGMYWIQQGRLPGNFELTSTVNNTMPLALAALGQTMVVLTRGIDLSVGGIVDLANALAALWLTGSVV
jgi:ribose transport system permease protein